MKEFLIQFEEYCKTPGVDSGKARSYAKAIEYLCDYLNITDIDMQAVAQIPERFLPSKEMIEYHNSKLSGF